MTLTRTQAATLGAVGIAAVGGVALVEHLQNEAQNKEEIGEHLKNQGFDKDTISAWQESPDLFTEARSLLDLGPTIAIDGSPLSPSTFNRFVRRAEDYNDQESWIIEIPEDGSGSFFEKNSHLRLLNDYSDPNALVISFYEEDGTEHHITLTTQTMRLTPSDPKISPSSIRITPAREKQVELMFEEDPSYTTVLEFGLVEPSLLEDAYSDIESLPAAVYDIVRGEEERGGINPEHYGNLALLAGVNKELLLDLSNRGAVYRLGNNGMPYIVIPNKHDLLPHEQPEFLLQYFQYGSEADADMPALRNRVGKFSPASTIVSGNMFLVTSINGTEEVGGVMLPRLQVPHNP